MLSYGGHIAFISCTINPVLSYPHIYPHFFCLYIYLGSFLVTVQKFCTTHCEEIVPAFPVAAKGRISLFLYLYMQWFGFCFLRDMKQICKMNSNRPFAYIWSCIILYTILLSADTVIYIYSLLLYVFVSGTKWYLSLFCRIPWDHLKRSLVNQMMKWRCLNIAQNLQTLTFFFLEISTITFFLA